MKCRSAKRIQKYQENSRSKASFKCRCIMKSSSSSCETTAFKYNLRYSLEETFPEQLHIIHKHLKWQLNTPKLRGSENFISFKKLLLTLQGSFISHLKCKQQKNQHTTEAVFVNSHKSCPKSSNQLVHLCWTSKTRCTINRYLRTGTFLPLKLLNHQTEPVLFSPRVRKRPSLRSGSEVPSASPTTHEALQSMNITQRFCWYLLSITCIILNWNIFCCTPLLIFLPLSHITASLTFVNPIPLLVLRPFKAFSNQSLSVGSNKCDSTEAHQRVYAYFMSTFKTVISFISQNTQYLKL